MLLQLSTTFEFLHSLVLQNALRPTTEKATYKFVSVLWCFCCLLVHYFDVGYLLIIRAQRFCSVELRHFPSFQFPPAYMYGKTKVTDYNPGKTVHRVALNFLITGSNNCFMDRVPTKLNDLYRYRFSNPVSTVRKQRWPFYFPYTA